jgi:hypothetical protein
MNPFSPIVPGYESKEIILAKNQPPYMPLPALPVDGGRYLVTRWRFSWRERLQVLFHGDLWLWVWTFGKPLQPVALDTNPPELGRGINGEAC